MSEYNDAPTLESPKMHGKQRWSPVFPNDEESASQRYELVVETPGRYHLEGPDSPIVLVTTTLRSSVGITLGDSSESDLSEAEDEGNISLADGTSVRFTEHH